MATRNPILLVDYFGVDRMVTSRVHEISTMIPIFGVLFTPSIAMIPRPSVDLHVKGTKTHVSRTAMPAIIATNNANHALI